MRLISWLAFGVLFLAVRRRHRRRRRRRLCQIAECRARYLSHTPDLLLPPPCLAVSRLLSRRRCRLNRTTTGDIKIMKCAGVVDSLLARPALARSGLLSSQYLARPARVYPGLVGPTGLADRADVEANETFADC